MPAGQGCCGGLAHHAGREGEALAAVRANVDAWTAEIEGAGLDAILVTASGCGTTVKDYGFMLRTDSAYAAKAARVAGLARDIGEYLHRLDPLPRRDPTGLVVAYHSGLLAPAWAENFASAERIAFQARLRSQRCAGRTFVLRVGRDLQHSSARACEKVARTQGREYREGRARCDCCRQYRLHHADRGGHRHPGGPYGRVDRLGDRRACAGGAERRTGIRCGPGGGVTGCGRGKRAVRGKAA